MIAGRNGRSISVTTKPKPRAAPPELSREAVVAAALAWVDAHGLEPFSVRALAKSIGVFPAAIYWYVPSRELLLAEVVAEVLRGFVPEWDGVDWRAYVTALLHNFRAAVRRHPNVAPLIGTQLVSNTSIDFALAERNLAAMAVAGFSGEALVGAHNTLMAALAGFTTQEFAPVPQNAQAWQQAMRRRVAAITAADYPALAANLPSMTNRAFVLRWENGVAAPLDDSFAMFIRVVIAGLEALAPGG